MARSVRQLKHASWNGRIRLLLAVIGTFACVTWSVALVSSYGKSAPARQREDAEHGYINQQVFQVIQLSLPKLAEESRICVPPTLPLYSKFIREHRPQLIPTDVCERNPPNWLLVSQSRVFLKPEFAGSSCTAEPIVRVDDQSSEFGSVQPLRHGDELPSLGFRASCRSPDGRRHRSVYYGVRRVADPEGRARARARARESAGSAGLGNIIMLGVDSLSRLESLRSLHRASHLMQSRLGAVTLRQYNILGDGTPAALLPILTGVREADMPEARKGFESARSLDESMRWIFQDLRDRGFLTLYGEEDNYIGTFQLRFQGFKQEPVDFYLRPALLQQERLQTDSICIGNELASTRVLAAIEDLFTLHPTRPKFAFAFFSSLSHENKDLSPMDAELSKFLEWFERANLTHNTSIILMSDHGQRHGPLRNSMQGKLEESLPLMSIALSRQLMRARKDAAGMLRSNSKRLTTPVDIHRTLLSIAGVTGRVTAESDRPRSYSLIDEAVPERRSCSQAGIPTHWCSCLRLKKVDKPDSNELAVRAARFSVDQMNYATEPFRHLCQELRLGNVTEADIGLAHTELAKRQRQHSKDFSFITVDSDLIASGYVSVRLLTAPGGGLYDATVQFALRRRSDNGGTHSLKLDSVGEPSRISRYGSQAACVAERWPHLRKFCFCGAGGAAA